VYVGIGPCAGLTKEVDGVRIVEDENYHQFPPVLQKLYMDNKNMHFLCIYIDPALENPVYITRDQIIRQKLFDNNQWIRDENEFCYENKRISVYPFRKSIKIKNTKYNIEYDYLDITEHIERLNNLAIAHNLLFVYHDFTGNENIKYIEEYFMDNISSHLDHIIYGFGNGIITGCYYDFRKVESFFAYLYENQNGRDIVKVFSIQQIINKYNSMNNDMQLAIPFIHYMNNIIALFPEEMLDIIMSQIKIYIDKFTEEFKNYIFNLLRFVYDIQTQIDDNKITIQLQYLDDN
jgi:hypothetical protein